MRFCIGKRIIRYLTIILFTPAISPIIAQKKIQFRDKWQVQNLAQEQGLPQNSVVGMVPDKYGFLWLATENGLARFDGARFKTFNTEFPVPGSSSRMLGFIKKGSDTIIAFDGLYNSYLIYGGQLKQVIIRKPGKDPILFFNTLTELPAYTYLSNDSNFLKYSWNVSFGRLRGFALSKDTFAVCHKDGIGFYSSVAWISKRSIPGFDYLMTAQLGRKVLYCDNTKQVLRIFSATAPETSLPLPFINGQPWQTLENVKDDTSIFISNSNYLFKVVYRDKHIDITPVLDNFVSDPSIRFAYQASSNTLVTSSIFNGIYLYTKQLFITHNYPSYSGYQTTDNNSFYAQALLPDQATILTGSNKLFDSNGFKGVRNASGYMGIDVMLKTRDGMYWYSDVIKSRTNQLYLFRAAVPSEDPELLHPPINVDGLQALYEDRDGCVWVSSFCGLGYYLPDRKRFVVVRKYTVPCEKTTSIQYIAEDNRGQLILATPSGIYRYDKTTPGKGLQYLALSGIDTRFVMVDSQTNAIWAGTYGWGFYRISGDAKKICKFPLDKGGNLRSVHCIVEDSLHRFWLSTNNGLFLTTRQSLESYADTPKQKPFYYRFSTHDGFATNEFNGGCMPAYLRLPGGTISLPSLNGLVWFKPDNIVPEFSSDSILLDRIFVNNQVFNAKAGEQFTVEEATTKSIVFDLVSYRKIDDISGSIEYQINTNNHQEINNWQQLDDQNSLTLTYPKSGSYTIVFRKRTGLGESDFMYLQQLLSIRPPWYKTRTFWAFLVVLLAAFTQVYFYWSHKRVLRRNRLLQYKITLATGRLIEQNKDLEKANNIKNKLITLFSHDISIPIFYMEKTLQRIVLDKEIKESSRQKIQLITSTFTGLQTMLDNLLVWIKMQQNRNEMRVVPESIDLSQMIAGKLTVFAFRMTEKNISYKLQIPSGLNIHTDKRIFGRILYNLIANAVDNLENGTIAITAFRARDTNLLTLQIENTPDTPPENRDDQNMELLPLPNNIKGKDALNRGIGLQLVNDFADLLHLNISYSFKTDRSVVVLTESPVKERDA
ncbi:MAG: HAMP domain-containing sensor histidine kinase [Bacteroidota bacterium]